APGSSPTSASTTRRWRSPRTPRGSDPHVRKGPFLTFTVGNGPFTHAHRGVDHAGGRGLHRRAAGACAALLARPSVPPAPARGQPQPGGTPAVGGQSLVLPAEP